MNHMADVCPQRTAPPRLTCPRLEAAQRDPVSTSGGWTIGGGSQESIFQTKSVPPITLLLCLLRALHATVRVGHRRPHAHRGTARSIHEEGIERRRGGGAAR